MTFKYGVLIPHFGPHATRERIVDDAQRIEGYGFDSIWVRDHLVFHPHHYEDQDRTFIDPIVALSAIAAVTDRITLATGSLIPHRHPVHAALLLAGLDFLAPGRVLAGWGIGAYDHEFEVVGMGGWDRKALIEEQVAIFRKLWSGGEIRHEGHFYQLHDVEIKPTPAQSIPIWYCGNSPAAVRRAVEYCEGWAPGRPPVWDFEKRMERMRRLAGEAGKPVPTAGVIPWTSPGRTVEEAVAPVNMTELLESAKKYTPPPSGEFETVDDLGYMLIAGPTDRIVEGVRAFQDAGAEHFVFDLRARFDAWDDCLEQLGTEILPALRKEDAIAA